jgi:hypothetical protein
MRLDLPSEGNHEADGDESIQTIESPHPFNDDMTTTHQVRFPSAAAITIIFSDESSTESTGVVIISNF